MENLRRDAVIWAAGFFDGEGCIHIIHRRDQTQSYAMSITVAQKDPAPLQALRMLFGGNVCHIKQRADPRYRGDMWQWRLGQRMAAAFLREIEPFLIVKKEQAVLALEFQARRLTPKTRLNRDLAAAQREKDEIDLQQMRALKRAPIPLPETVN